MPENRHITNENYENWFLLYADNELSEEEKLQVLQFVNDHPHLKYELENLLSTKNIVNEKIVFPKKENLFKKINFDEITDEEIILFLDEESNDLIAEKIRENQSQELQKRIRQLKKTHSVADTSVFYNKKEKLYKRNNLIMMHYWLPRAAAAVAILIFGFWMFENNFFQSAKNEKLIVKNVPKTDAVFQKKFPEMPDTIAIAKSKIEINQKENSIIHQNKDFVSVKKSDEKKSIIKISDSKFIISKTDSGSFANELNQKIKQPEILVKTEIPMDIQKKNINPFPEFSNPSSEEMIVVSPQKTEKKANRFFKNLSEKLKEKTMAILSDDDENIIVAGFAINVRK
jgi:hypothetical protein